MPRDLPIEAAHRRLPETAEQAACTGSATARQRRCWFDTCARICSANIPQVVDGVPVGGLNCWRPLKSRFGKSDCKTKSTIFPKSGWRMAAGTLTSTPSIRARWGAANASLAAVPAELIAALEKEDQEAQAAMARNVDTSGWTAEMREFHQLGQRTSMAANTWSAGIALRQLDGGHAGA